MKKLIFIPILLLIIFSCTDPKDKDFTIKTNDIIGEWNLSEYYLADGIGITSTSGIIDFETQIINEGENFNVTIVFSSSPYEMNSTGIYTLTNTRINTNGTTTSSLNPQSITPFKNFTKWSLENGVLSMEDEINNTIENYTILEVNENVLKLEYEFNETYINNASITEDSGSYLITLIR